MSEGYEQSPDGEASGAEKDRKSGGATEDHRARGTLRWALESGSLALLGGAFLVFRGLSSVAHGKRLSGLAKTIAGAGLITLGRSQWRDRPAAPLDDRWSATGPNGDAGTATGVTNDAGTATGMTNDAGTAAEDPGTADASAAQPATEPAEEGDTDQETATEREQPPERAAPVQGRTPVPGTAKPSPVGPEVDVLGASAFDQHGLDLPIPQRAFNQGFLSPGEVFWGVRLTDGAVVVSDLFDPIWDDEDFHYLGSSEVAEDRTLRVPDAVLDTWDRTYDGGDAVVGGDDITFLTTPALAEREQLRVVPAAWRDVVLGEGGEA
ncbi:MAG: hypothetical protein V5A24_05110 [Haloarculaceae archaeon]